ncbi:MAG: hypothetical protein NVS3B3_07540 [Aquirhabdus sp.]
MHKDIVEFDDIHFSELRGFLNALEQLCGDSSSFFVNYLKIESELQPSIASYFNSLGFDFKLIGIQSANYEDIKRLIDARIFSKLNNQTTVEAKKKILWHLIEYYGLISTSIDENGEFNPLSGQHVFVLDVKCSQYISCDYYMVLIKDYAIITSLGELNPNRNNNNINP